MPWSLWESRAPGSRARPRTDADSQTRGLGTTSWADVAGSSQAGPSSVPTQMRPELSRKSDPLMHSIPGRPSSVPKLSQAQPRAGSTRATPRGLDT